MENLVKGVKRTILTEAIQKSARTNNRKLHVLPSKGRWGVKWEGSDRFYRVFSTKLSALNLAKKEAKSKETYVVIVHNKDGRIASATTYE